MTELRKTLEGLAGFGKKEITPSSRNPERLALLLSKINLLYFTLEDKKDSMKYSDPPDFDLKSIKKYVTRNFPDQKKYAVLSDVSDAGGKQEIRDASEEICVIIHFAMTVHWFLEKTTSQNAVFHFKNLYREHFAQRILGLLQYLLI